MKLYFKFARKFILILVPYYLLSIVSLGISFIQPIYINKFIDGLIMKYPYINTLINKIIILGFLTILLGFIIQQISIYLVNNISFDYICYIVNHYNKSNLEYTKKFNAVYLCQRIKNDVSFLTTFYTSNLFTLILNILCFLFSCIMLIKIDTIFMPLISIFIPLYFIMYKLTKKPLYNASYNAKNTNDKFTETLTLQVSNLKSIKIKAIFNSSVTKLKKSFSDMFQATYRYSIISYLFSATDNTITLIFQVSVFLLLSNKVVKGQLTIGQFLLVNTYFSFIMSSIKSFIDFYSTYLEMCVCKNRIYEILSIPLETNGILNISTIYEIKLENLSFSYNYLDVKKDILKNINLKLVKNNLYTIKGNNGVGKSTFLDVLLGLYINSDISGKIQYNNEQILDLDMYTIRNKLIGFIEQENILSDDTVFEYLYENIPEDYKDTIVKTDYLNKIIDNDCIIFFENEDFSINSIMDKKISFLSGGQQQKVKILRELLKNPQVILFDEPNTSLDKKSINQLVRLLARLKKDRIIVIITHDDYFDNITDVQIQLRNNELIEVNTN